MTEYPEPSFTIRYWDVRPRRLAGPLLAIPVVSQLQVVGSASGVVFSTTDEDIAAVNQDGEVLWGAKAGRATISAWEESAPDYVRTVEVVVAMAIGTGIQPTAADPEDGDGGGAVASVGHRHDIEFESGGTQPVGSESLDGTSKYPARKDHVHAGGGGVFENLEFVRRLPPIPTSGIKMVVWCSAITLPADGSLPAGNGEDIVWVATKFDTVWLPLYSFTQKIGTPGT